MILEVSATNFAARHGALSSARHGSRRGPARSAVAGRAPIRLALIGIFTPKTLALSIGGLFFSPGRAVLALLFLPALGTLLSGIARRQRAILSADLFMLALSVWMIGAALFQEHSTAEASLATSGSEVLEILGAFLVGRAYVYGRAALESFTHALAVVVMIVTALAVLDTISGHAYIYDTTASWSGVRRFLAMERLGIVRAQSTFDHPILFGAFEVVCAAIFLHARVSRHLLYMSVAVFGIILSMSSAPLLAFVLMVGAFWYGKMLNNFPWRWKFFWAVVGAFIGAIFMLSNSPVGWIIDHLTFDAENGYFRLASWYASFDRIAQAPWIGFFKEKSGNDFLDSSVDCVWLVCALLYGLPTIALLLLANLASFWGTPPRQRPSTDDDDFMRRMRMGFTAALAMFMLVGLTVHYWNAMWMFWGLCIGIRTSLQEHYLASAKQPARGTRSLRASLHPVLAQS
jgi:hypothetical protein